MTRAVRIRLAAGGCLAERCELGADPGVAMAAAKPTIAPAVFVVADEELPALRRSAGALVDRGRKHRAKALGGKLLGQAAIPVIAGGYRAAGQLLRSVRALLARATKRDESNVYAVSVPAPVFSELWQRPAEPQVSLAVPPATGEARTAAAAPARGTLGELLPELPVPEALRRTFVGESLGARLVRQLILRANAHQEPVLILGDTGTGKEVVARLVHDHSRRAALPFNALNCGAIPRELLESELFGQEPSSHSTATVRKQGLWRATGQGTLFLDEVADLSPHHQVKILRVHARIVPPRTIAKRSRLVAATFREDLYYRLRAFLIRTPPLREHPEDIPLLAAFFWRRITRDSERRLAPDLLAALGRYSWPGNVRELKALLSSLYALFGADQIGIGHLRAVFEFEGQAGAGRAQGGAAASLAYRRIECLQHLRRVDEVLRACQIALRPLAKARLTEPSAREVGDTLGERIRELDLLCRQPLLFHSEVTFTMVSRLEGRLRTLREELRGAARGAARRWQIELGGELDLVLAALFREVERLQREA